MSYATAACVTKGQLVACAVIDSINFGLPIRANWI